MSRPPSPVSLSRPYEIVPYVERTRAWWEWRQGGVGSADAGSILGEKRSKSVERLLIEKQHRADDPARSFVRERGVALERAARAQYGAAVGAEVRPVCVQSVARPWQRASLDGLTAGGERVVEIKCGLATYQAAAARRRPPRHHFAQLQHILAVTGLPVIDYWCHVTGRPPLHLEVVRDPAYIERLVAAEELFWKRIAPSRT